MGYLKAQVYTSKSIEISSTNHFAMKEKNDASQYWMLKTLHTCDLIFMKIDLHGIQNNDNFHDKYFPYNENEI